MIKTLFLIISLTLLSCKPTLKPTYKSKCLILGEAEYVLKINDNGKFQFKSHLGDTINGNWTLLKDTLILNSEYFIESSSFDTEKDSIVKNTKFTEFDKQEKYIFKRKKLFLITRNGISKECYLK
jgi:hypothetical protein